MFRKDYINAYIIITKTEHCISPTKYDQVCSYCGHLDNVNWGSNTIRILIWPSFKPEVKDEEFSIGENSLL